MAMGFEGSAGILSAPRIKSISLFVNNMCNLHCPYCYLTGINGESPVEINTDATLGFIKKIHKRSRLESVAIVGREPFLSPEKTFAILAGARAMGVPKISVVTNATLVTKEIAKELAMLVSFVDVSLDGLQETHEITRGKGNFTKTISGIEHLLNAGADVFVLHKVDGASAPQLSEFAQFLRNMGVRNMLMFPIYPREISVPVFMDAIDKLISHPPQDMLISVKGDYLDGEIFSTLSDFVREDEKRKSKEGIDFIVRPLKNNSTLRVMLENSPAEFRRGVRIDHRGQLVFCADQARNINRPVGTIYEEPEKIFSRVELIEKIRAEYAMT